MHKLIVSLPLNRDFEGELRLEAENGRVLAGPFPVCGRADREAARRHGNPTGQATLPFGDTPLGRYRIAGIQATGRKTSLPVEHFGPHEVVVLTPVAGDAALADANGRFCILIQGGTMGAGRRLRPTNGSLRLADKDQKALIRALRKYRPPCTCECVADTAADGGRMVAKNAPFETLDPPLPVSAVNPTMTAAAGFERGQFSPEGSRFGVLLRPRSAWPPLTPAEAEGEPVPAEATTAETRSVQWIPRSSTKTSFSSRRSMPIRRAFRPLVTASILTRRAWRVFRLQAFLNPSSTR